MAAATAFRYSFRERRGEMRKITVIIFSVFMFFGLVQSALSADKAAVRSYIDVAKASVEKVTAMGSESAPFSDDVLRAQNYLKNAEIELKNNISFIGSITGSVKDEGVPTIKYYADMAKVTAEIVVARIGKLRQEKENVRLEKMIPDIQAKIKFVADKDNEIKRLREELAKPQAAADSLSKEITILTGDKAALSEEIAALRAENKKLKEDLQGMKAQAGTASPSVQDKDIQQ